MARVNETTKAQTRERLLYAAADEFAARGVAGANINQISLNAGLAKGTVYNYFDSKEALFLDVVREACTRAASEVHAPDDADTATWLRALVTTDVAWVGKNQAFAKVLMREALGGEPERYQAVLEAEMPFITRIVEILERGQARGEVRSDVPSIQLALTLGGLLTVAYLHHWGAGSWPSFEEMPDLIVRQFLEGAGEKAQATSSKSPRSSP